MKPLCWLLLFGVMTACAQAPDVYLSTPSEPLAPPDAQGVLGSDDEDEDQDEQEDEQEALEEEALEAATDDGGRTTRGGDLGAVGAMQGGAQEPPHDDRSDAGLPIQPMSPRDAAAAADATSGPALLDSGGGACDVGRFEGSFGGSVGQRRQQPDTAVSGTIMFEIPATTMARTPITGGLIRGQAQDRSTLEARIEGVWDCQSRTLEQAQIVDGVYAYRGRTDLPRLPFSGRMTATGLVGSEPLRGEWSVVGGAESGGFGQFTGRPIASSP